MGLLFPLIPLFLHWRCLLARQVVASLLRVLRPKLIVGDTGRFVEDLPESTQEMVEAATKTYYTRFQPSDR